MRTRTLITAAICALPAGTAGALATPAARAGAGPVTPSCAWETEWSADTINTHFPDTAAAYWIMPFTVQDGLRITLDGVYPDSRYASVNLYPPGGGSFTENGVDSWLTDYQIDPNPGSVNPWQHPAPAGGHFTVTVRPDAAPDQVNALPLAPAGTAAGATENLLVRVYAPAGGDFSRVRLPDVTFTLDGVSKHVPTCPPTGGTAATATASADAGTPVAFSRLGGSGSGGTTDTGFVNPDAAYVGAAYTPPAGSDDVVVVRGKAPRSAHGAHPSPWPAAGKDMRYWSMCDNLTTSDLPVVANHLPDGTEDYGCRDDDQTALDMDGYYTYVVGTEAQRAVIEALPGVTFVPFSADQPTTRHVLLLRNMVVDPGFAEAVQNITVNQDPAAAAAVMGDYYPRAVTCPFATVGTAGPGACLS